MMGQALIYGGSGGIGSAVARALSARGVPVHLVARREAELSETARSIGARYSVGDVCDPADITRVTAEAGQFWNGGASLAGILVTGGGALLLGDAIRQRWPHARIVADPVFSNAAGFSKLAARLAQKTG